MRSAGIVLTKTKKKMGTENIILLETDKGSGHHTGNLAKSLKAGGKPVGCGGWR